MTTAVIDLPPKLVPVFTPPRGEVFYRCAHGGRGSGKSFSFALMAAVFGYAEPLRILCTRDIQNSIRESFHAETKSAIQSTPWLSDHYEVGANYIRGKNGTEFIFRGLRHNISAIKSMAQIDLCIVEEADDVPESSWIDLIPTIRAERSEIWVIWNPRHKDSPVDKRFRQSPPPRMVIAEVNHRDNPWFPSVLEMQRQHARKVMDPATYAHIWEGAYLVHSDAQIFKGKWRVDEFEAKPDWDGPYYGLDFGFSQDPTAALRCWVHDQRLFIDYEAGKVGLELDHTRPYLEQRIPGIAKHVCRADSARPESISYLQRHGLPRVEGVEKWSGSVEDGIEFIKSFLEVVIHPRCRQTANEFLLYSFAVDRWSGDIKPTIVDANNHYIDALRYALAPLIRQKSKLIWTSL